MGVLRVLAAVLLVAGSAACSQSSGTSPSGAARASAPPLLTTVATLSSSTPSSVPAQPSSASAPDSGGDVTPAAGVVLPNRERTPGATNPAVTQANIGSTICVRGWTATVRPPESYTTPLKKHQLATGYTYEGVTDPTQYEEDHLISLEIGGSPTAVTNLWPEPYFATEGAHVKDKIENKLHELVCSHALTLVAAQHAIATNWWTAYERYLGVPAPATSSRASALPAPRTSTTAASTACTRTSSGSCIKGGEFCPQADYGRYGYDAEGTRYLCTGSTSHPHWE